MAGTYVGNFRIGNNKLDRSILIFNMGTAKKCPSRKLGLCKVCKDCYAKKAEVQYKDHVINFRERQAKYWLKNTEWPIIADLSAITFRRKYLRHFRYNESGDFYGQECITKMNWIADFLKTKCDIITYGYTARSDLDFSKAKFIVRGSGWEAKDGQTTVLPKDCAPFKGKQIQFKGKNWYVCPGEGCGTDCLMCMSTGRFPKLRNIGFVKH